MSRVAKMKLLLDVVDDLRSLADSLSAIAEAMTQGEAPAADTTPAPPKAHGSKPVTLEQVRAVLAEKSHDGLTAEVRALLQKYGADKLSAVDPQHYAALLKDAEVLGDAT